MDEDKFFRPKTERQKADVQEKRIAKVVGGRTTINSGALPFQKGDIEILEKRILIEAKRTDGKGIRILKSWLTKLRKQAKERIPVMHIEIDGEEWYMVRKEEFYFILQNLEGG